MSSQPLSRSPTRPGNCEPTDWSPDGRTLIVNVRDRRGVDIWTVSTEGAGAAQPLLAEAFVERDARFSPEGRWLAYVSEESGRPEVSVRSLSIPPQRIVISSGGGDQPVWRRDGGELFYVDVQGRLLGTPVSRSLSRQPGIRRRLAPQCPGDRHGTLRNAVRCVPRWQPRVFHGPRRPSHPPREIGFILGWRGLLK